MTDSTTTELIEAPVDGSEEANQQPLEGVFDPFASIPKKSTYNPPPLSMIHKKRLVLTRVKALEQLFLPDAHRESCDPTKRSRAQKLQYEAAMEAIERFTHRELCTIADASVIIVGDHNEDGNVEQWENTIISGDIEDIQAVSDHLDQLSQEGVTVLSLVEKYGSDKAKKREDADVLAQPWNNAKPEFMEGNNGTHKLISMFRNGKEEQALRQSILDQIPESAKDTRIKLEGLEMHLNQIKDRKHLQALLALAEIFKTSKPEHQDDLVSFRHVVSAPKPIALSLYAHVEFLYRNPGSSLTFILTATKLKEQYGIVPNQETWRIPAIEKHMQIRTAYERKFGDYEVDSYFNNPTLVEYVQNNTKKSHEVEAYVEAYGVKNFNPFACSKYYRDFGQNHRK